MDEHFCSVYHDMLLQSFASECDDDNMHIIDI